MIALSCDVTFFVVAAVGVCVQVHVSLFVFVVAAHVVLDELCKILVKQKMNCKIDI